MLGMNVLKPAEKAPSYKDQILILEVNEKAYAPYDKRTTIAPIISSIKREFKGREYETKKVSNDDNSLLEIIRIN